MTTWKNKVVGHTLEAPDQLLAHYANARTHEAEQRDAMRASLDELGIIASVIVNDRTGNMIDGHMRTEEFLTAGIKEVPVEHVDLTPEEELKAIAFFDAVGKLAGVSRERIEYLIENIELDSEPLEKLLTDLAKEAGAENKPLPDDIDDIPEVKENTTKLGDIWLLDNHRVLCGDATNPKHLAKLMDGDKADLVWTDPPYNVDYEGGTGLKIMNDKMEDNTFYKFLFDSFTQLKSHMKAGAPIYIAHADSEGRNFRAAMEDSGLLMKQCIIWVKSSMVLGRQDYQWQHEPILYGWNPGASHKWYGGFDKKTVYEDGIKLEQLRKDQLVEMVRGLQEHTTVVREDKPKRSSEHPTMKPVKLVSRFIWNSSMPKNIIVDTFLGSGSTLIAAETTQRRCYGMELDPHYVDVVCKRFQKTTGTMPILEATGEAHDFLKE